MKRTEETIEQRLNQIVAACQPLNPFTPRYGIDPEKAMIAELAAVVKQIAAEQRLLERYVAHEPSVAAGTTGAEVTRPGKAKKGETTR